MTSTLGGLPAHILLLHAVVVLVPLTAVLLLVGLWPAARARLGVLTAVLAVLTLIAVPLTTEAGEWLEHRVPTSELVRTHTELGDTMLPWAIGLAVVAVAVVARDLVASRAVTREGPGAATAAHARTRRPLPGGRVVTGVLAVAVLVVSVGSVVTVYRIGDSGARAAWTGQFSEQPTSGPGSPGGPQRPPDGDDG